MGTQPTAEDMELISAFIELPIVLSIIESNIAKVNEGFRMHEVFRANLVNLQSEITNDLRDVRAGMRRRGIKIVEEIRKGDRVGVQYLCRGYLRDFQILHTHLKNKTETRLAGYLKIRVEDIVRD
ncbi:hypothetical protein [Paenibacillus sp. Y412MC10]|uniref:hypothetical protein n=1 Tax=Geobacillus sp. (strain Y412MC10) TaxID=481743 RepID=UPI00119E1EA4|nr:hypothetical protein [Paenibacillus sp. Y412MC10]